MFADVEIKCAKTSILTTYSVDDNFYLQANIVISKYMNHDFVHHRTQPDSVADTNSLIAKASSTTQVRPSKLSCVNQTDAVKELVYPNRIYL